MLIFVKWLTLCGNCCGVLSQELLVISGLDITPMVLVEIVQPIVKVDLEGSIVWELVNTKIIGWNDRLYEDLTVLHILPTKIPHSQSNYSI